MGFVRRRARWAPLVVSLVLLAGLGGLGLSLVRSATAAAEQALADGAIDKQRTVAALTDQYLKLAAKEAFAFGESQALTLAPGDPADTEVLAQLLRTQGGFFDHAVALMAVDGAPLNVVGSVPPPEDPGYGPLHRALLRGEAGVSWLMWDGAVPVVAVGVPVMRDDAPAATLIAHFRADTSMLQRYSQKLGEGTEGVGMVVDGAGTIVAARHERLVGTALAASPAIEQSQAGVAGHAVVDRGGTETVTTWAPIDSGSWTLVEEEPASAFYASVRGQSNTAQLVLLVVLLAAAVLAAVLNHRTDRVRRRGARRAEALVRDAHDVITIVDTEGRITYASPAMDGVLGFTTADFVGRAAMELVHPDDRERVQASVAAASGDGGARQRVQARIARADGTYCPCELVVSDQSRDRTIRGTIVSMRDITELVALHDQLSYQALHDPLTELPNRTQLERRLGDALGRCTGRDRVAVLFLDLDGFKAVNDDLGHDRGDELLVQVAGRLRTCVRDDDTVARLGGDEFVVVLADDDVELHAARVASRTLDVLAEPFLVGGATVTVGASIGIAVGGPTAEPDILLREADAAMYLAKDRGRFRYEFPSAGLAGTGTTTGFSGAV